MKYRFFCPFITPLVSERLYYLISSSSYRFKSCSPSLMFQKFFLDIDLRHFRDFYSTINVLNFLMGFSSDNINELLSV